MNVHEKINEKQGEIVRLYLQALFRTSKDHPLYDLFAKNMPRNLRYGGFRNTCYDFTKER